MVQSEEDDGFRIGEEEEEGDEPIVVNPNNNTGVTPVNPKVLQLQQLFPNIDEETISIVLEHSQGNLELATESLLNMNDPNFISTTTETNSTSNENESISQMESDEAYARSLGQEETDRATRRQTNNNNNNNNASTPLTYQPYTPRRSRNQQQQQQQSQSQGGAYSESGRREQEEPVRPRDELDQLTEGLSKLAGHGSRYAEQGKKTLGSLFSKVKEQINKFEDQRNSNHDDYQYDDDSRPLPAPPTTPNPSGAWTPPSALPRPQAPQRTSSNASFNNSALPKTPTNSALPKLPTAEMASTSEIPPPSKLISETTEPVLTSTPVTSAEASAIVPPVVVEEPKKDFSKIGLLPRQPVSLSANKGHESEDEEDLEYVKSPFDED